NKSQNANYGFKNKETNSINNGEDSLMNQMLDYEIQSDNDLDNTEDKKNEIDYYEKESLEYNDSWD
ncbi:6125_t:CDS:1, partial [Ambispora leptoticha]